MTISQRSRSTRKVKVILLLKRRKFDETHSVLFLTFCRNFISSKKFNFPLSELGPVGVLSNIFRTSMGEKMIDEDDDDNNDSDSDLVAEK